MSIKTITYNQRPALFVRYHDDNNHMRSKRVFTVECGRCEQYLIPHPANIGYADWANDYVLCHDCVAKMKDYVSQKEEPRFATLSELSKTIEEMREEHKDLTNHNIPSIFQTA